MIQVVAILGFGLGFSFLYYLWAGVRLLWVPPPTNFALLPSSGKCSLLQTVHFYHRVGMLVRLARAMIPAPRDNPRKTRGPKPNIQRV